MQTLKKIDYLADIPDEVVAYIAMNMKVMRADKDEVITVEKNPNVRMPITEMRIIFSGKVCLQVEIDGKLECLVDCIGKGTILDANNFLCNRYHHVTAKAMSSVIYYYLEYPELVKIA